MSLWCNFYQMPRTFFIRSGLCSEGLKKKHRIDHIEIPRATPDAFINQPIFAFMPGANINDCDDVDASKSISSVNRSNSSQAGANSSDSSQITSSQAGVNSSKSSGRQVFSNMLNNNLHSATTAEQAINKRRRRRRHRKNNKNNPANFDCSIIGGSLLIEKQNCHILNSSPKQASKKQKVFLLRYSSKSKQEVVENFLLFFNFI